jgi:hypothetical protein
VSIKDPFSGNTHESHNDPNYDSGTHGPFAPPDRLGRVVRTTVKQTIPANLSYHDVEIIISVLARAREHLAAGHTAITANLIRQAEQLLGEA